MKLISFVVCSYNAENWMRKCIDSLLVGGEDVEIIVVNDGSKDHTGEIADEYAKQYPTIVKAVHQENGGHGAGIMAGVREATGEYFKVVDSDDWLDHDSLLELIQTIKDHKGEVDMYISDYIYYTGEEKTSTRIGFSMVLKPGKITNFTDIRRFGLSEYITIHSATYKTSLLREANLDLPRKTFFEDNLFTYRTFPLIKKVCYLKMPLYYYLIGRPGQSVAKENALKRYRDYIRVAEMAFCSYNIRDFKGTKGQYNTMFHQLRMIMCLGFVHVRQVKGKEAYNDFKEFKKRLKAHDKKQYRRFRYRCPATAALMAPHALSYIWSRTLYWISSKVVQFN